jgi:hypothetical protein
LVPRAGVEPARPFGQRILSPQRLPFRHPGMLSVTLVYQAFPFLNHQYPSGHQLPQTRPDAVIEAIAVAWDAAEGRSDVKLS